jgi:hypothetical protein
VFETGSSQQTLTRRDLSPLKRKLQRAPSVQRAARARMKTSRAAGKKRLEPLNPLRRTLGF